MQPPKTISIVVIVEVVHLRDVNHVIILVYFQGFEYKS